MRSILLFLVFLLFCALNGEAQGGKKRMLVKGKYDEIDRPHDGFTRVLKNKKQGCINSQGQEIIPCMYDDIEFEKGFAVVMKKQKHGLIDSNGIIILPCVYDEVRPCNDPQYYECPWGDLILVLLDHKWGMVNRKAELVIPAIYDEILDDLGRGYHITSLHGEWGVLNASGKVVVPFKYWKMDRLVCEGLVGAMNHHHKWGFVDTFGKEITEFKYDKVEYFQYGTGKVSTGGETKIVDRNGNVIPNFNYTSLSSLGDDTLIKIEWLSKWGIITKERKFIVPIIYDQIGNSGCGDWDKRWCDSWSSFKNGKIPVKLDQTWGIMNKRGAWVIPAVYEALGTMENATITAQKNGKWGIIDTSNNVIVPFEYERAYPFYDGRANVRQDNKWGYCDSSGHVVIPIQYDDSGAFRNGAAIVKHNSFQKKIDKTGKTILQPATPGKYTNVNGFSESLAIVADENNYCGFINKQWMEVLPCIYEKAEGFSEGLAMVQVDGKCGFINKKGEQVIPCKYDNAYPFTEGLAAVKVNGKWGFVDTAGQLVIACTYDQVSWFSNGYAPVQPDMYNSGWGAINKKGALVVDYLYYSFFHFSEGLATVDTDNSSYQFYIDTNGKIVIGKFSSCNDFHNGLALVEIGESSAFINKEGKIIRKVKYHPDRETFNGLSIVVSERRGVLNEYKIYGVINEKGKLVIPLKYDRIYLLNSGFIGVQLDSGLGIIDRKGKVIVPLIYEELSDFSEGLAAVKKNGRWGYVDTTGKVVKWFK